MTETASSSFVRHARYPTRVFPPGLPGYPAEGTLITRLDSAHVPMTCSYLNRMHGVCTRSANFVVQRYPVCSRHRSRAQYRGTQDQRWYTTEEEYDASLRVRPTERSRVRGRFVRRVAPRDLVQDFDRAQPTTTTATVTTTPPPPAAPPAAPPVRGGDSVATHPWMFTFWHHLDVPNVKITFSESLVHAGRMPRGPVPGATPDAVHCVICMDSITLADPRFSTSCGHHFHGTCMAEYCIAKANDVEYPVDPLHMTCPMCRDEITDDLYVHRHALLSGCLWSRGLPSDWLYWLIAHMEEGGDFVLQHCPPHPILTARAGPGEVVRRTFTFDIERLRRAAATLDMRGRYTLTWATLRANMIRDQSGDSEYETVEEDEDMVEVPAGYITPPATLPGVPPPPSDVPTTTTATTAASPVYEPTTPLYAPPVTPPSDLARLARAGAAREARMQTDMSALVPTPPPPAGSPAVVVCTYQDSRGFMTSFPTADTRAAVMTFPIGELLTVLETRAVAALSNAVNPGRYMPVTMYATRTIPRTGLGAEPSPPIPDWMRSITVTIVQSMYHPPGTDR